MLKEAKEYHGPSLIIAYSPCIAHGIKGGLENSTKMQKDAVECGYFPLFHYHPEEGKFYLDSKNIDFGLYDEFLNNQTRYAMLKVVNPNRAKQLLKENKENAIARFEYYQKFSKD